MKAPMIASFKMRISIIFDPEENIYYQEKVGGKRWSSLLLIVWFFYQLTNELDKPSNCCFTVLFDLCSY